jgi:GWxTD domain-containing protein
MSGSYRLELAVVDRNNVQYGNTVSYYFERINETELFSDVESIVLDPAFQASITDDSLQYFLGSLLPISRPAEAKNILATLKTSDKQRARKHIQQFWLQTSGSNAYDAWIGYKKQVQMVEELYATNYQSGFETDRGRVYLQYGLPNSIIIKENNPSEYPYEIWHYYKIKVYSNKRFVFYNPDLVNNAYRLLHSDLIGEQQNYRWQQALSKRNSSNINIDDPNDGNKDHYGGESNYYYRQD